MTKRVSSLLIAIALLLSASLVFAGDSNWTGVISDSHCGAAHAKASQNAADSVEKCVKGGSQYVFVNSADNKVYKLDDQSKAKGHGGQEVTVTGTLKGDTIHVSSISMTASK
jgi:hypothetical protein